MSELFLESFFAPFLVAIKLLPTATKTIRRKEGMEATLDLLGGGRLTLFGWRAPSSSLRRLRGVIIPIRG